MKTTNKNTRLVTRGKLRTNDWVKLKTSNLPDVFDDTNDWSENWVKLHKYSSWIGKHISTSSYLVRRNK